MYKASRRKKITSSNICKLSNMPLIHIAYEIIADTTKVINVNTTDHSRALLLSFFIYNNLPFISLDFFKEK